MYTYIHHPFVDMRESSSRGSKVVSQALFGEEIQVVNHANGWFSITTPDGYAGWVPEKSFIPLEKSYCADLETTRLKAHVYGMADTEFGPILSLPYGSKLHEIGSYDSRWVKILLPDGREAFIQKGDVELENFELVSFSKKFLGLPYTWGGRSSFGYDCSGFVQMLYSKLGIQLPRDARQQIADGRGKLVPCGQLKLGDLVFWGKSEGEIRHVGMSLSGDEFIHTSSRENKPYLRISKISDAEWSGGNAFYSFREARRYFEKS